jgi:amidase
MVPVAHANDGGGSIRLPAAWCGLVGLKPSRGRISEPLDAFVISELVVSRTVRDVAAVLDAVQGSEPGDLFVALAPARSYQAEVGADPGKLRIGMLTRASFGDIHPECLAATQAAAKLLESLGHEVEESFPEALLDPELHERIGPLARSTFAGVIRVLSEILGRPTTRDDVEPYTWSATELMPSVTADEYLAAMQWLIGLWRRRVVRWWSGGFDLLLTPTVWEPPATLESMMPVEDKWLELKAKIDRRVFFTSPFNLTGHDRLCTLDQAHHNAPRGQGGHIGLCLSVALKWHFDLRPMLACDERRIQLAQQRPEFGRPYQKHAALAHRALNFALVKPWASSSAATSSRLSPTPRTRMS